MMFDGEEVKVGHKKQLFTNKKLIGTATITAINEKTEELTLETEMKSGETFIIVLHAPSMRIISKDLKKR